MLQHPAAVSMCQLYQTLPMAFGNQFTSPFPPMGNKDNNVDLHRACKKHLVYLTYGVPSINAGCYRYSDSETQIHPSKSMAGCLAEPVEPRCQRSAL